MFRIFHPASFSETCLFSNDTDRSRADVRSPFPNPDRARVSARPLSRVGRVWWAIRKLRLTGRNSKCLPLRRRRCRRSPHYKAGRNQKLALNLRADGEFRLLAESFKGCARQVGTREADGGKRRQRELGEVDIVQADDRKVLRYAQALHAGGAQYADGGHVVGTENGRGPGGQRLHLAVAA